MSEGPDLTLAGLRLWIKGRANPDAHDFWDGNWLSIRALVEAHGAAVEASGTLLRIGELAAFVTELLELDRDLKGRAVLNCLEPGLQIEVECGLTGHVSVSISITPDHLAQSHTFRFTIDQSYLKPVLADCKRILASYPVRGDPNAH